MIEVPRDPTWPRLRASAHTDYGGFTILSGEDVPGGLQVRTRREQWVNDPTSPTTFVVNIGEPPRALDERPLALEHAPRGESLGRRCLASQGLTGAIAADPRRDRSTV